MDDLISRQAAIATMKNYIARWSEHTAVGDTISRQAAIDAILHNQEVYSNNFGDDPIDKYTIAIIGNDAQTIAQLPSVQRWIPWDSGKPPEESGTYTVTAYDGVIKRVTYAKYQKRLKRWELTGARAYWRVLAWMPLPEPYKGE